MNADQELFRQRRWIGFQCQANTSSASRQVRSRFWHICQLREGHGDLHLCYCGQHFDDLGEVYTWDYISKPTVWTETETNEPH